MESLWRMRRYWRQAGCSLIAHQAVVYLYIVPHPGLSHYRVHGTRLLDEHKALHAYGPQEPVQVVVKKGETA